MTRSAFARIAPAGAACRRSLAPPPLVPTRAPAVDGAASPRSDAACLSYAACVRRGRSELGASTRVEQVAGRRAGRRCQCAACLGVLAGACQCWNWRQCGMQVGLNPAANLDTMSGLAPAPLTAPDRSSSLLCASVRHCDSATHAAGARQPSLGSAPACRQARAAAYQAAAVAGEGSMH